MQSLKKQIHGYMYRISFVLVVVVLCCFVYIQLITEQKQAYDSAVRTIAQMESVLEENYHELLETHKEYEQLCLRDAEIVARILKKDPSILYNTEELRKIAALIEVNEIHLFDAAGHLFSGTHPQYFGYTFDSGEQMQYFKPMLEDKTLQLVQGIAQNTAEEKSMQYSAVWSEDGKYIIQVGMEPVNIMRITEKNELSHIFLHFRVNTEADYFAVDGESGRIIGTTNEDMLGRHISETGIPFEKIQSDADGFHAPVYDRSSFCVFERIGNNYLGRTITSDYLYHRIPKLTIVVFISLALVVMLLAKAVVRHMDRSVIKEIDRINANLKSIADGELEETAVPSLLN